MRQSPLLFQTSKGLLILRKNHLKLRTNRGSLGLVMDELYDDMTHRMRRAYVEAKCSPEPDRNLMAAQLLMLAAITLIGPDTPVGKELLYVAERMSHPLHILKDKAE